MLKCAPSSRQSPPQGLRNVRICWEEAGKEKITVSREIWAVCSSSFGVLAAQDQPSPLGFVCAWLGCPQVPLAGVALLPCAGHTVISNATNVKEMLK